MRKRFLCMLFVVLLVITCSLRTFAEGLRPAAMGKTLAKPIVSHKPNPLASAMLLVLAGVGVSMLFDKRK